MLEPVVERLQSNANIKTVFGEPFESHGKTLVPVATVAYGFGGGAGSKRHSENGKAPGEGGGMGGGARATPAGVLEITDDHTRFVRFGPNWRMIGAAAFIFMLGMRFGTRRGRRQASRDSSES